VPAPCQRPLVVDETYVKCPIGRATSTGQSTSSSRSSTCTCPRGEMVPRPVFLHPSAGHRQSLPGGGHHRQGSGLPGFAKCNNT
jgi:hypothetical protein